MAVFSKRVHIHIRWWDRISRVFRRAVGPAALATLAVSGMLALASCNMRGILGQTGHGQISLRITDTPVDGARKVVVAFNGIDLKGPNGIVTEHFASEKTVDLLTLQGDASAELLNNVPVQAGDYQWIRLDVDLAKSYVELDSGTQHPLNVPSGSQTGLKLVSGFTLAQGSKAAFVIDFDLRKALTMTTTGKTAQVTYMLKPALRLANLQQVGKISGYAGANLEIGGTPIGSMGCSPAVYVYQGSGIIPEGYNVAVTGGTAPLTSANPTPGSTTGKLDYTAAFLSPGTYSLAVTCAKSDTAGASTLAFSAVKTATVAANSAITVNFPAPVTYAVTYDSNGATGGTVPVDSARYQQGASVTVLDNTGALVKSGTTFTGWNTAPDGSGTAYAAGATFPMGSADVTLYAEWAIYLYTANEHDTTVSAFSIGSSGVLNTIHGPFSTGLLPSVVAVSPNGEFLYTTNIGDNTVSAFSIGSSGAPASIQGTFTTGKLPLGIAISPNSKFLYTTNNLSENVSAFSIGPTGVLSSISGTFSTGKAPYGVAISPNGEYLYTVNYGDNSVSAFTVGLDGALGSISGSFSTGAHSAPYGVAISPNGEFLYTANIGNNTVSAFTVGSSGVLSSISGTFSTGKAPYGIAISPNGGYLYTANSGDGTVSAFAIGSSGALTYLGSFSTGSSPSGIAISPNGKFLYTANPAQDTVSAFLINSNGTLGPVFGPFTTGLTPVGIAITQ